MWWPLLRRFVDQLKLRLNFFRKIIGIAAIQFQFLKAGTQTRSTWITIIFRRINFPTKKYFRKIFLSRTKIAHAIMSISTKCANYCNFKEFANTQDFTTLWLHKRGQQIWDVNYHFLAGIVATSKIKSTRAFIFVGNSYTLHFAHRCFALFCFCSEYACRPLTCWSSLRSVVRLAYPNWTVFNNQIGQYIHVVLSQCVNYVQNFKKKRSNCAINFLFEVLIVRRKIISPNIFVLRSHESNTLCFERRVA